MDDDDIPFTLTERDRLVSIVKRLSCGYTKIIPREELMNHNRLDLGKNGVGDRWANKYFNYTVIYKNNKTKFYGEPESETDISLTDFEPKTRQGITGIFVHSERINSAPLRPIREDIIKEIKKRKCVVCGTSSDIICDHKNDLYNDERVLNRNTQTLDDFQALCIHCNFRKRQVAKTKEFYSIKNIPQFGDYPDFPWEQKNNIAESYWYDPIEFHRKIRIHLGLRRALEDIRSINLS